MIVDIILLAISWILKWTILWITMGIVLEVLFRRVQNIDIKLYFAWYDFWLGWFYDQKGKNFYFGFFPMLGIKIHVHDWYANDIVDIRCHNCTENRQGVIVW